jgi:hypothetical protein
MGARVVRQVDAGSPGSDGASSCHATPIRRYADTTILEMRDVANFRIIGVEFSQYWGGHIRIGCSVVSRVKLLLRS